ncbi:DNA-binding protein, partial [Avibacterium paragallinarum]|uniref:DNA-binding protein n=2 Tax=Avibacterium paragallinarum TaxID=728 RepID=UPI00243462BB
MICLRLSVLPTTKKAVIDKAKRENWQSRKRVGRGGGLEYALSSLPQDVQDAIRDKFATSVVVAKPKKLPVMRSV